MQSLPLFLKFKGTALSVTCSGFCAGRCDLWSLIFSGTCSSSCLPPPACQMLISPSLSLSLFFNLKHPSGDCHDWRVCNTECINGLTALSISSLPPQNARYIQADRLPPCPLLSEGLVHFSVANVPFLRHIFDRLGDAISLLDRRWMLPCSKIISLDARKCPHFLSHGRYGMGGSELWSLGRQEISLLSPIQNLVELFPFRSH